jgi:hypothetical protein
MPDKILIGIEAVKKEYRRVKLQYGDYRGMKNKYELAEKLGINPMQILFYSNGGGQGEKTEIEVEIREEGDKVSSYVWTMKDLVDELKKAKHQCEIEIVAYRWNKIRTDRERIEGSEFIYKAKNPNE